MLNLLVTSGFNDLFQFSNFIPAKEAPYNRTMKRQAGHFYPSKAE